VNPDLRFRHVCVSGKNEIEHFIRPFEKLIEVRDYVRGERYLVLSIGDSMLSFMEDDGEVKVVLSTSADLLKAVVSELGFSVRKCSGYDEVVVSRLKRMTRLSLSEVAVDGILEAFGVR